LCIVWLTHTDTGAEGAQGVGGVTSTGTSTSSAATAAADASREGTSAVLAARKAAARAKAIAAMQQQAARFMDNMGSDSEDDNDAVSAGSGTASTTGSLEDTPTARDRKRQADGDAGV
jgi:hypothetical protein